MRICSRALQLLVFTLTAALITSYAHSQPADDRSSPADAPAAESEAPPPPKKAPKKAAAEPVPAEDDEPPPVSAETKQKAKRHFVKGIKLLREQAWAPALAEFLLSRDLYPTRVATNNAAISLRKLQRYDEALDMFENLLRGFKVPPAELTRAQHQIAELRSLVGTIDIQGAEPGASIVISSVDRGQYPPVSPIRVPAGNHVVRVFKEGFEPFDTRIDVAGGQVAFVTAKLSKLKDSGKLRIVERTGRTLDVLVDSVVVGKSPWEGTLSVGDHMVRLRGKGKIGSQPAQATVKSQELTQLSLVAEDLDASLRIDPTPPGASVWLDSVNVGNGIWLGRLKTGSHTIEAKADGFLPASRTIELQKGQRENVAIKLEQDEDAPRWRKPSKWTVDVGASFVMAPTLGGDVADRCGDGCEDPMGLGGLFMVNGSYELGSGLGFGIELGYLIATKEVAKRESELTPNGTTTANVGTATDNLRLSALLAGASAGYHFGEDYPVTLRVGAGVLWGQLRNERSGHFPAQHGGEFDAFPVVDFPTATYVYIAPAARAGYRLTEHLELSVQIQALLLVGLSQPKWDESLEVAAATDGIARYSDETLMGSFVGMFAPGVDLRYTF
ncbi:MAG: PEGA domain-containing protein [Deltaproteobacteria bacterium]|nr:PEGA domain-containing protein [Deltaproteobacteria bacterium]